MSNILPKGMSAIQWVFTRSAYYSCTIAVAGSGVLAVAYAITAYEDPSLAPVMKTLASATGLALSGYGLYKISRSPSLS